MGQKTRALRTLPCTYTQAAIDHGIGALGTMAVTSTIDIVGKKERMAARIITGCTRDTPKDALMTETGLLPPEHRAQLQGSLQHERSTRLPDSIPSKTVSNDPNVELRLKKKASKRGAPNDKLLPPIEVAWKNLMVSGIWNAPKEETTLTPVLEPLRWKTSGVEFHTDLLGIMGRNDAETNITEATNNLLKQTKDHDIVCYSDGSAEDGTRNCGAGGVVNIPEKEQMMIHKACELWHHLLIIPSRDDGHRTNP